MAQQLSQKFTILKVLLQNLNKKDNSSKGFTLLELIVGLVIMVSVGGLAMNAFIQASTTFNEDKKNIDSSQNLSAILELIGNDIKQSGEQMNDRLFPVIEMKQVPPAGDGVNTPGSSIITIRRALIAPLTLCENIASNAFTQTTLRVADDSQTDPNCQTLPSTTPPSTTPPSTTSPAASGTIFKPARLKEARDKRCQLDKIDDSSPTTTDFCLTTKPANPADDKEKVLAAISDENGRVRTFEYVNDTPNTSSTMYQIQISNLGAPSPIPMPTVAPVLPAYDIGSPIYLIEERTYKLDINGNFQMRREKKYGDDRDFETLIKSMKKFNVSARVYGDKETKVSDMIDPADASGDLSAKPPIPPGILTTNKLPKSRRCDDSKRYYICSFNTGSTPDDWKTIQGIKVELQGKYDSAGRGIEGSAVDLDQVNKDKEKLEAKAEFFPRNVLSK